MKIVKTIMIGMVLLFAGAVHAQVSVNLNLGTRPQWGPVGYPEARYYYLPDVEAYYDTHTSMFVYSDGKHWVQRRYLPSHYRNYDLYHGQKIVMKSYRGNYPYAYFKYHKTKYAKGFRSYPKQNYGHRPSHDNYRNSPAFNGHSKQFNQGKHRDNDGDHNKKYDRKDDRKENKHDGKHGGGGKGGKHRN